MIRKITTVIPEHWHMDGGVAFGVVPKGIWSKLYPVDENNNLHIVNRLVLIETDKRLFLVNTGFGDKRSDKYYQFKYISSRTKLSDCISDAGYHPDEVTDLIFTHLHDDHCGGATIVNHQSEQAEPLLKNAKYWISENQWNWALNPNPREAASYFQDNFTPLNESGNLNLLKVNEQPFSDEGIELRYFEGHTSGQMIPVMKYSGNTVVFVSDFIPSAFHIPLPFIASVDIAPLLTLSEKETFLEEVVKHGYILLFEHDFVHEACRVIMTEKGYTAYGAGEFQVLAG
jgi:glyoxylase-like metal-dependent hydrolase (beta-lactamase superfamily II)